MMKMKNVVIKKLDQDDILEILLEHFQDSHHEYTFARGELIGGADKDLRFIGVFGKEADQELYTYDLKQIDTVTEFNGDHMFLKINPEFQMPK